MSEKVLNTKIALLYKTYSQWDEIKSTYKPLKGEVCFCEVPTATGVVTNEPAILFKVGDGVKTFAELPWSSALAADVFAWAKKEHLDFSDLDTAFLAKLDERIQQVAPTTDTQYRIVVNGTDKWKLQKSVDGSTWVDAEGQIDISGKVDKLITWDAGKSYIFNEYDGGGSKFEGNNGVVAYVGTHDNIGGEIGAQIYVDKADGSESTIIDVTQNGAYYTKGAILPGVQRDVHDNEIVTFKDIKDIVGVLHFRGVFESLDDVTDPKNGDVAIVGNKEFVYVNVTGQPVGWKEFGDEGIYETKAEAEAAHAALVAAISAEEVRAKAEEAKKVDKEIVGVNGTATIFNESDGGGAKFVHDDGTESFVGVNDGGKDGIAAQIYADRLVDGKWQGAKLDVTNEGIYYTVGNQSAAERDIPVNEIATKGDISELDAELAAIAKTGNVNDLVQSTGDVLILNCNL